jgi:hypothetical protein
MNKIILVIKIVFLLILSQHACLYAHGIGLYGSYGVSTDIGFGVIYETALSQNTLFSDRIALGYNKSFNSGDRFNSHFVIDDNNAFLLMNTFSFGFFRNKFWRIYIGPAIGFEFLYGGYRNHDISPLIFDIRNWGEEYTIHKDYTSYGINGGVSFGVNMNPGNYITISFQINALANINISRITTTDLYFIPTLSIPAYVIIPKNNFKIQHSWGPIVNFNVAILYRIDDNYKLE